MQLKTLDSTNNFIRGILLKDTTGNIWYSNESGIDKCDVCKERVLKVRAFAPAEFRNMGFKSMALDTTGVLWLFNIADGIFAFDTYSGKLTQYPLPVAINLSTITHSYSIVDSSGTRKQSKLYFEPFNTAFTVAFPMKCPC